MQFLGSSKRLLRIWLSQARASIVREMEFRANFLSGLLRQFLWLITFITFIEVIFQNTDDLAGWSKGQVLVILALSRLIEGIMDTFFSRNITDFPNAVQNGNFDYYLTKPVPIQFYVAFLRFRLLNAGNIIAGITLLVYAFSMGSIAHNVGVWLMFVGLAFLGIVIYYCLLMIAVTLVFYLEQFHAYQAFTTLLSEPLTVPFDVFPFEVRAALSYLIPLAFVVFVPAQALTGRLDWQQIPVAIAIAIIFLLLANLAWRAGLRRYSSASS